MAANCRKAVSYLAEESGIIASLIQQEIMTGDPSYAFSRIKETKYDTNKGHNPRFLRFRTTPPTRRQYGPILPSGNQNYTVNNAQSGVPQTVVGDKTGIGCSIPADTINYGYDVKNRTLLAKALEAGPWCIMDLLEKEAVGPLLEKLRVDLPRYAKEDFGRQLLRDVITFSEFKYSIAEGFPMSQAVPYFPAVPTGGPSIGFIRKIETLLKAQGWDKGAETPTVNGRKSIQVRMSREAIEFAIIQRKTELDLTNESRIYMDDGTFGKTEIYEGIQFIEADVPTRGYLRQVSAGQYEFVEIDPTITTIAGGEGFWVVPNPEFYQAYVSVGGERLRVVEVGFIIHPTAMERQAMGAIPSVPGKTFTRNFNFEVNPIPDYELADRGCNKDGFFFGYRLTHAYAPLARNPELMTAFLYLAPTNRYTITDPWSDESSPTLNPVNLAPLNDVLAATCGPCVSDAQNPATSPIAPTPDNLFPTNVAGTIAWNQISYVVSENGGALTMVVERNGGNLGAATVVVSLTAGSATNPTHWTTPAGFAGSGPWTKTFSWADGVSGPQTMVVPIVTAGTGNKVFTGVLGSVTGATIASGRGTATVTIIDEV